MSDYLASPPGSCHSAYHHPPPLLLAQERMSALGGKQIYFVGWSGENASERMSAA